MKPVRFHPAAEAEMVEAAGWYETQREGLGRRSLPQFKTQSTGSSSPRSSLQLWKRMFVAA